MDKKQVLDGEKILSLLHELDTLIDEPCRIIICGGAAAIVAHGLKRLTGDINSFEPIPKAQDFYAKIKKIQEEHGLDAAWFNESAKGFLDCLGANFKKRLITVDKGFKNLEVYAISKADLVTMKICAWRESDKEDIQSLGVGSEDLKIITENVTHLRILQPDMADKAERVLGELGLVKMAPISAEKVANLAELIQYYKEQTGKEVSLEDIRKWKDRVSDGLRFSSLAKSLLTGKEKGMDI
jgi:hypothetical protein